MESFQQAFGARAKGKVRAPGRVNLIGEHTDYNDGFVLPIAIEREVVARFAPRADRQVRFASAMKDQVITVGLDDDLRPVAGSWGNYPVGVLVELKKAGLKLSGVDVFFESTVPSGGGLSSSAALEVATALALMSASGQKRAVDGRELALLCQRAENLFAGAPCGIMDQSIAVLAQKGSALLLDCRTGQTHQVPFADPDIVLLVADTQVKHDIGEGGYPLRRKQCHEAAAKLGVKALRDVTPQQASQAMAKGILTGDLAKRVRHVVGEIDRTLQAVEALGKKDFAAFGQLMFASHAALRDDFEVSCEELDAIVEAASTCQGVYGARMTGGGFGGCAIVLVKASEAQAVTGQIQAAFNARYGRTCPIFSTHAGPGASEIE